MISATEFKHDTIGKKYELDGVPREDPFQCADYFKEACRRVLGYHFATGGDGYVDNWWYNRQSQHPEAFEFITDWTQFQNGDFVIWSHAKRDPGSPFPSSHIGMYWQEADGHKYLIGQNQPYKYVTAKIHPDAVWAKALGALRFKAWAAKKTVLQYGYTTHTYNGIEIKAVRGPRAKGYDLHVLSGDHDHDVKNIDNFDSPKLRILGGVNANYFRLDDGTHLGCEGDGYVAGYQQIVPLQKGWIVFFQKDGQTACWDSPAYYYDQSDVDFCCTPYACRMLHGTLTFKRSLNCGDKDDVKNTQTMAMRFTNKDWAIAICSSCFPREAVSWAQTLEGIQDVILMDSGGSSQMFECTSGKRKVVKSTGRKVANVLVIAAKIDPAEQENKPADGQKETDDKTPAATDINALQAENEALKEEIKSLQDTNAFYESHLNAMIDRLRKAREATDHE